MQISKKTVIFLMIFSIILVGITIAAILYTSKNWKSQFSTVTIENNSKNVENGEGAENINAEPFSGTTTELSNTYKKNALYIKDNVVTEGNPIEGSGYSEKIKITYPEISNLADSTIKTNINENIREKVFSYYNSDMLNDANIKHLDIKARVIANFSDVLSIRIDIVKEQVDGNVARDFTGLNYRLENGEQISFKNIFINNASIKNILRHGIYNSIAWDYLNDDITDMNNIDYSNIDETVYQILNAYNKNENPDYCFSEKEVIVKLNNRIITLNMEDFIKQVAIYNRYVSQNQLYASTSMANDIPILVDRDEYSEMDVYMKVNENLIIDMSLNIEGVNRNSLAVNTAIDNYKTALNNSINTLKDNSEKNDDEYVYFISRITVAEDRTQNKLIFNEDTYRYTAYSKTQFDVYITSPILTETRDLLNDSFKTRFDLNDSNIDIEKLDNVVEYNLTTGNLYGEEAPVVEENNTENQTENTTNVPNTNNVDTNTNNNNTNGVNNEVNENTVDENEVNNGENNSEGNNRDDTEQNDDDDDESTVVTV